jgi:hypothetical protein
MSCADLCVNGARFPSIPDDIQVFVGVVWKYLVPIEKDEDVISKNRE